MDRKAVKLLTYCLTGTIIAGSYGLTAQASSLSSLVPGAGMEAVMIEAFSADTEVSVLEQLEAALNTEYDNMAIADVKEDEEFIVIREEADDESESLGKLYERGVAFILENEEDSDWMKIESGEVTGYVKCESMITGDEVEEIAQEIAQKFAVIKADMLKVREEDNTDAKVLMLVAAGDELEVVEATENDWLEVVIGEKEAEETESEEDAEESEAEDGEEEEESEAEPEKETAFVAAEYVELKIVYPHAESKEEEEKRLEAEEEARRIEEEEAESEAGRSVSEFALQFVGNPYVWGGTSLTNGADCSGFVMSVYKNFGVSLPHSSASLRGSGDAVDYDDARAGDIICYDGHVGIYIGDGQIVHASSAKTGIKTSTATYREILAVRRIF